MREKIEELGGRRFLLSISSLYVSSALLIGGWVGDSIYRDIVLGTVGAYILGNTWQKLKGPNDERAD